MTVTNKNASSEANEEQASADLKLDGSAASSCDAKLGEVSRRSFIAKAAVTAAAATIVPRHVLGRGYTPPSDLLNVAGVGVGGMGRTNLVNLSDQNIVAICDVDWGYADKGLDRLETEITALQKRIAEPPPPPTPEQIEMGMQAFNPERAKIRVERMQRLKDVHLPKLKRYGDYREMLDSRKISMRCWSPPRITCTQRLRSRRWS